jgi:hypothetical protein
MPCVSLGNPRPIFNGIPVDDPTAVTVARVPPDRSLAEAVADVVDSGGPNTGFWPVHSAAPAPSWVESDDPDLAAALADHFGCPVGRPSN